MTFKGQWRLVIDITIEGTNERHKWVFEQTASEAALLAALRCQYQDVESHIRSVIGYKTFELPQNLIDDVFVLIRCLVMNRLEQYNGTFVYINPVGKVMSGQS
jgi:hypothetical protein